MARLIDADALKKTFCAECNHTIECEDCDIEFHFEHLAPTIDAVPVKHGYWQQMWEDKDQVQARCSNCKMVFWIGKGRDGNYCPNCGAKMDEVEE